MRQNQIVDRTWMERARRMHGFTQAQVAQAAGVTTTFYNRVEKGLYTPNVVTGIKIADFLNIDVRSFLTEEVIEVV